MNLGTFDEGATVTLRVVWTRNDVPKCYNAAAVSLEHEDGETVLTASGVQGTPDPTCTGGTSDEFTADVLPEKEGRWYVRWTTTPAGGVREDSFYVRPSRFV